jgi:hypothetical protein
MKFFKLRSESEFGSRRHARIGRLIVGHFLRKVETQKVLHNCGHRALWALKAPYLGSIANGCFPCPSPIGGL